LSTIFDGVIQNGNGASGSVPSTGSPTSINKVGSGTLTLNGVSTFTGTAVVNGGTLSGAGTVSGAATFNAGTILSPGSNSVGTLTFGGNLTLNAASTNNFAVTTAGGASNSVTVAGTLNPNSSVIQITSGTALAVGTYTLFNYSGISGSFNATPVFDVAPAAAPTIVDTGTKINLVIGTPAGPTISSITPSGSDLILNATGGSSGGSVSVLTSTDLTVPLASWTVVTTGNYDGSGNFSYTVSGALSSGQPQQFYILQQ
jgi:autotransporter-associated beta strand protein